uniref:6-bladed beta-propeller n=1 Tax=uncultured Latescibacterota bacterium TaxID=199737 RepID=Q2Z0D7_9BACT|nr:hypothetical protein [uncultured Latescibacterota bacterium]
MRRSKCPSDARLPLSCRQAPGDPALTETLAMWTYRRRASHRRALTLLHAAVVVLVSVAACPGPAKEPAVPRPVRPSKQARVITGFAVTGELPGTQALRMRAPEAVAVDHRGDVVIADTGNHRVLVVGRDGELVDEFGGYGWDADRLDTPGDVCVYRGFYTYVLDEGNRRVVRYDVDGDYVDVVVAEGDAGSPVAIAVGTSGGLLLVDADTQSVLSYSQFDERLTPFGRFGLDAGGLVSPVAVAVGPSREVAVADPGRSSVEVYDEFGASLYALSSPDTLAPSDIAFDSFGNVLVVDERHNRLLAFPAGGGPSTASLAGEAGFRPTAVATGVMGELVVLDGGAGRIQVIETVYGADARR